MHETVISKGDELPVGGGMPSVSIIVATLNVEKTLQRCIDSIATQTWANKELIICDGGSKDRTTSIISANQVKVAYWCSEPDSGIYSAWNKGIAKATGEWICFLGADDYFWAPDVLERMAWHLGRVDRNIRVVYGQVALVSHNNDVIEVCGEEWGRVKKRFRQVMAIPHQAVMHRRSLFEEHGEFREAFRIAGDYDLLLRELRTKDAVFVPGVLTAMQHGGISTSPKNSLALLAEVRSAQKMNSVSPLLPGWRWVAAVTRVKIRHFLQRIVGDHLTRKMLDIGRKAIGKEKFWTRTE